MLLLRMRNILSLNFDDHSDSSEIPDKLWASSIINTQFEKNRHKIVNVFNIGYYIVEFTKS